MSDAITPHPPPKHLHPISDLSGMSGTLETYQRKLAEQGKEIKGLRAEMENVRWRIIFLSSGLIGLVLTVGLMAHYIGLL